jgi:peptidoglycan hydrolase CwlO-like protein
MALDTPTVVAIVALVGTVLTAIATFRSSSKATDVNARAAELAWVKELRQDAADARDEVEQLRVQVRDLRRQLDAVTREADHWISEHQAVRRHVWRNGMTIDRLRDLVGPVDPFAPPMNRPV